MMQLVQEFLAMTAEVKEMKAILTSLRKTRIEKFKESWIDGQEVMAALSISSRTLQALRDNGTLRFSRLNGKFYYKVSDLETLLESNYSGNSIKSESVRDF